MPSQASGQADKPSNKPFNKKAKKPKAVSAVEKVISKLNPFD